MLNVCFFQNSVELYQSQILSPGLKNLKNLVKTVFLSLRNANYNQMRAVLLCQSFIFGLKKVFLNQKWANIEMGSWWQNKRLVHDLTLFC